MDLQGTVDVLNELIALEQASLAPHLVQSTMFVCRPLVKDSNIVHGMAQASVEHAAWLADTVLELGGVPGPRVAETRWANLHYQDLRSLLPHLIADREDLVNKYARALNHHVSDEPRATEIVARIHNRHKQELTTLRSLGH